MPAHVDVDVVVVGVGIFGWFQIKQIEPGLAWRRGRKPSK